MRVRFWGVRGSIASPGANTLRIGGNTACVAVESACGELIVLDAGSGFCPLGDTLMDGPFGRGEGKMTLLLSHIHMDHLIGFTFAIPVYIPGNEFTIYGPATSRMGLEELHQGLVSPAYSPIYTLDNFRSTLTFRPIPQEPINIGDIRMEAQRFPHGAGSFCWGFKLSSGNRSLVYIPDVEYRSDNIPTATVEFVNRVDLLIHDAYFTAEDFDPTWGHCRSEHAVMLAETASVDRLVLFHHSPERTDAEIDALVADHRDELLQHNSPLRIDAAYEGMTIQL
jgi:phosphoribosyl 1,2-cyclic phosphodiesterase